MFILGQLLHLFWIRIPSIRKRTKTTNSVFILKEYWKSDWNLVIGTLIFGALLILGLKEILKLEPNIIFHIRWFFAFAGLSGQAIILSRYSKYEKELNDLISIKSNIADGIKEDGEN